MNGFNKVIIAGNLTRDPDIRYTQSGTAIATAAIALNRKWKDATGEPKQETTFVDWKAFGDTAALAAEYLRKGNVVLIDGRLNLEQWEDRDGTKRSKLVVIAEHLTFLPNGQPAEPEQQDREPVGRPARTPEPTRRPASPQPTSRTQPPRQRKAEQQCECDDVPF